VGAVHDVRRLKEGGMSVDILPWMEVEGVVVVHDVLHSMRMNGGCESIRTNCGAAFTVNTSKVAYSICQYFSH
jgi:hypothetical protein